MFGSQLRDDFQFALPAWLSPYPRSLTTPSNLLVPINAFKVSAIMPQTLKMVNACG
jgi:hypothetical protein